MSIYDPRDTRPHDLDTTVMGPGFFVFFNYGIIESGGFFDYPDTPTRVRDEKPKPREIIERVAKRTQAWDQDEREMALRVALEVHQIRYRKLYLTWLEKEAETRRKKAKQRRNTVILLLLDS